MKVPAKKELEVRCEVAGPPIVRIIDATLDGRGFEYTLTKKLEQAIRKGGVAVNGVSFPKTPAEFFAHLSASGPFNTLLLVAHGEVQARGCWATIRAWFSRLVGTQPALRVKIAGMLCPWQLLGAANAELTDKIVLLAVCGGHCPDSTWTWVTDQQLALLLVASRRSVSGSEVLDVFPPVLQALAGSASITPEKLDAAVRKHNVKDAFEVFSGVGVL